RRARVRTDVAAGADVHRAGDAQLRATLEVHPAVWLHVQAREMVDAVQYQRPAPLHLDVPVATSRETVSRIACHFYVPRAGAYRWQGWQGEERQGQGAGARAEDGAPLGEQLIGGDVLHAGTGAQTHRVTHDDSARLGDVDVGAEAYLDCPVTSAQNLEPTRVGAHVAAEHPAALAESSGLAAEGHVPPDLTVRPVARWGRRWGDGRGRCQGMRRRWARRDRG